MRPKLISASTHAEPLNRQKAVKFFRTKYENGRRVVSRDKSTVKKGGLLSPICVYLKPEPMKYNVNCGVGVGNTGHMEPSMDLRSHFYSRKMSHCWRSGDRNCDDGKSIKGKGKHFQQCGRSSSGFSGVGGGHHCVCCNCGGFGHMYRNCNQPITSYGCIVYRWIKPNTTDSSTPSTTPFLQYLMVQRRDSLAYVEFLRGKYRLDNVRYISHLLRGMTCEELARLRKLSFDELWTQLWTGASRNFVKEQIESDAKLTHLKNGYILNGKDNKRDTITLDSLITNISDIDCLPETEWGFPKGRRNLMESDKACAIREFREETGIRPSDIRIRGNKPLDEVFTGSNGVRYRHVYYVAEYVGDKRSSASDTFDCFESNEIKTVKWMTFSEAMDKFSHRDCNVEKRELLKRVDSLVMCRYQKESSRCMPFTLCVASATIKEPSYLSTTGCWRRAKIQRCLVSQEYPQQILR